MSIQTIRDMNSLPTALLTETFSYLDLPDLARCSRTNARWQQLAKNQKAWVDVLQTPYEIGQFIISQVSDLNNISDGKTFASVSDRFALGPTPSYKQMKQGLILEASDGVPVRIYTRYGHWRLIDAYNGNFKEIFKLLKNTLKLTFLESSRHSSLFAIQSWKGQTLPLPIQEDKAHFIPNKTAKAAFAKFQEKESLAAPAAPKKRKIDDPQLVI